MIKILRLRGKMKKLPLDGRYDSSLRSKAAEPIAVFLVTTRRLTDGRGDN